MTTMSKKYGSLDFGNVENVVCSCNGAILSVSVKGEDILTYTRPHESRNTYIPDPTTEKGNEKMVHRFMFCDE